MKKVELIKRNLGFIIINILIIIGIVVSITLPYLSEPFRSFEKMLIIFCGDAIGTAAQIVTATVGMIVSVIAISISLQKEEFFGINVKEFYKLRKKRHYSIPQIIGISFAFCIGIAGSYMSNKYVLTIGLMIAVVLFLTMVMIVELPLMIKKDLAAYAILRDNLFEDYSFKEALPVEVITSIQRLLYKKTFREVYLALKDESDEAYNQYVFEELLDIQSYLAWEAEVKSKEELNSVYRNLLRNIHSIIENDMGLSDNQYAKLAENKYFLTRTIFGIWKSTEGEEHVLKWIPDLYKLSFGYRAKGMEVELLSASVIVSLIANTVKEGDFKIIRSFRKYLSSSIYGLNEPSQGMNAFAVISAHLYYLCCLEPDVPNELKEKIKVFLEEGNYIEDQTRIRTWRNLFRKFSYQFQVDYQEFISLAEENRHNLEVYLLGTEVKRLIWEKEFLTIWFLTHFLNQKIYDTFNYNQLESDDLEVRNILERVGSECINMDDDSAIFITPTETMCKIIQFYDNKVDEAFRSLNMNSENIHAFVEYINRLKVDKLEKRAAEINQQDFAELADNIKKKIENQIHQEWGYNKDLAIQNEQRAICFEFERLIDSKLTTRIVSQSCIDAIFNDIKEKLCVKLLSKAENNDSLIESILSKNIKFATWSAKESIHRFHIKDENLKTEYKKRCKEFELIHSHILGFTTLVKEGGFSFNCTIDEFELRQLTEEECLEKVKEYQREDGQYVYEGAFLSKDSVIEQIKSAYAVITVILRHGAYSSEETVFTFE